MISVPGSKSYTNRALLVSSLVKGRVVINNPLMSGDTKAFISCLQALGISIIKEKNNLVVKGDITKIKTKKYTLNTRLSGTTMRFLLALCCIIPGTKIITGEESLCKRPIKDLVDALRQLRAKITYLQKEGYPPVSITSSKLSGKDVRIAGSVSSQFLSALLMILPIVGDITISLTDTLISKPYIDMTLGMLKKFGVTIEHKNYSQFFVKKQSFVAKEFLVEGDYSSASYFGAIAALTMSDITIENVQKDSLQADKTFFIILETMGNKITYGKNFVRVEGTGVKPLTVDMESCPDQIQTVAVLAAFAHGKTIITGTQSLAVKETNRSFALKEELAKMGIKVEITKNTIVIFGGKPKPATIETYNDHRMAMSFAVAGSALSHMKIKDPDVVDKTFPQFWKILQSLGMQMTITQKSTEKIVLIGFMGAGKTTLAPLLAKRLKKNVVEMDTKVVEISKQKSIKNIFEKYGEKKFREFERQTAQKLGSKKPVVISAGGGVVENEETMGYLSHNATIIFLQTQFETILNRLVNIKDRPMWRDKEKTKQLFINRQALYERYADIIVTTDGKSLGQITNELEVALRYL